MICPYCGAEDMILRWRCSLLGRSYIRCTQCTLEVSDKDADAELEERFIEKAKTHTGPAKD